MLPTQSKPLVNSHHHGLRADLNTLMRMPNNRRASLRWLGLGAYTALPVTALIGCGGASTDTSTATPTTAATTSPSNNSGNASTSATGTNSTSGVCSTIPTETGGPYPGDGTNTANGATANALTMSGIVRSNITSSLGGSAVAAGIPLTITLKLVSVSGSCSSLAGYAIYLWHCTQTGGYSMYSSGITGETYLRGVQVSDTNGEVTFTTIFPGCYAGRVPHMHFEVYASTAAASNGRNAVKTSQLTFPVATCQTVYTASGYAASVSNLAATSFASDGVFSDGVSTQLATITGSNAAGYAANLTVGI
jgi:protocatechuate 3,4-dioxygenase beta subunit